MGVKPVLVLDGSQRSALAVTRSLGRKSIPVITASENPKALGRYSTYSHRHVVYPDPKHEPDNFLQWLKVFLGNQEISVVFPLTDVTSNIIAPHGPMISGARIPLTDVESIKTLSDKTKLVQLAEHLDIPNPRSIYISQIEELEQARSLISYPCVVKPSFSRFLKDGQWMDTAVTIVSCEEELNSVLKEQHYLWQQPFMVQEYIEGTGQGIFALYSSGKEIAWFAHRRLREKPPWGGVSVLSESIALPLRMVEIARKLLDSVCWHGVAMVEYKVSSDGTPYLIEINTRFWGSLQLAVNAGVDFPYLLYLSTIGQPVDHCVDYKVGQRLRWLLGDLDSLLITLKSKDDGVREKLLCLVRFFTPDFKRTKHEIFEIRDPKPAVFELQEYAMSFLRKLH